MELIRPVIFATSIVTGTVAWASQTAITPSGIELERLADRAAGPVLARVHADQELVSEMLKPVFDTFEARLFDRQINAIGLCENCVRSQPVVEARFARELGLGTTPFAYFTACRMAVGASLLLNTDLMVFQIGRPSAIQPTAGWHANTPGDGSPNPEIGPGEPAWQTEP